MSFALLVHFLLTVPLIFSNFFDMFPPLFACHFLINL